MDGESLVTLIGIMPGPDCLKDLIPKIGLRLKVYRCIKACYDEETNKVSSLYNITCGNHRNRVALFKREIFSVVILIISY